MISLALSMLSTLIMIRVVKCHNLYYKVHLSLKSKEETEI